MSDSLNSSYRVALNLPANHLSSAAAASDTASQLSDGKSSVMSVKVISNSLPRGSSGVGSRLLSGHTSLNNRILAPLPNREGFALSNTGQLSGRPSHRTLGYQSAAPTVNAPNNASLIIRTDTSRANTTTLNNINWGNDTFRAQPFSTITLDPFIGLATAPAFIPAKINPLADMTSLGGDHVITTSSRTDAAPLPTRGSNNVTRIVLDGAEEPNAIPQNAVPQNAVPQNAVIQNTVPQNAVHVEQQAAIPAQPPVPSDKAKPTEKKVSFGATPTKSILKKSVMYQRPETSMLPRLSEADSSTSDISSASPQDLSLLYAQVRKGANRETPEPIYQEASDEGGSEGFDWPSPPPPLATVHPAMPPVAMPQPKPVLPPVPPPLRT